MWAELQGRKKITNDNLKKERDFDQICYMVIFQALQQKISSSKNVILTKQLTVFEGVPKFENWAIIYFPQRKYFELVGKYKW